MKATAEKPGTYNGWRNYETWAVNLWLDESRDYFDEQAADLWRRTSADATFSRKERATLDFADMLKDEIEENTPELTGMFADLLNAAISEIDWYEIAEPYFEDMTDDDDDDSEEN